MIKIKNRQKSPVQLIVRSRTAPRSFTTLVVPGIGANKNTYLLEDERTTEYVVRAEKAGLISTQVIPNSRKLN
jgi:hypothetical protein